MLLFLLKIYQHKTYITYDKKVPHHVFCGHFARLRAISTLLRVT